MSYQSICEPIRPLAMKKGARYYEAVVSGCLGLVGFRSQGDPAAYGVLRSRTAEVHFAAPGGQLDSRVLRDWALAQGEQCALPGTLPRPRKPPQAGAGCPAAAAREHVRGPTATVW